MNRRSFIRGIFLAAAAPTILLNCDFKWKTVKSGLMVPNPAWVTAEFECYFSDQPMIVDPDLAKAWTHCGAYFEIRLSDTNYPMPLDSRLLPLRYEWNAEHKLYQLVQPYLTT